MLKKPFESSEKTPGSESSNFESQLPSGPDDKDISANNLEHSEELVTTVDNGSESTVKTGQPRDFLFGYGLFLLAGGIISILIAIVEYPILRFIFILTGAFTFFIQRFSYMHAYWGGFLIVISMLAFLINRRGMFILIGMTLMAASIMNIFGGGLGGWTVLGVIQFLLSLIIISCFWDYASQVDIKTTPHSKTIMPEKVSGLSVQTAEPESFKFESRLSPEVKVKKDLPQSWNTVRIFISSTFRDMHAERDHLVKVVFPELRERCAKRRLHLIDVDLRWGVTEEEAEQGKVLEIILDEVERSRPFFIGILGERYGSIPDDIPEDAKFTHPWLQDYPDHSFTALEIVHGVLSNLELSKRSFFYFRDPEFISKMPENMRSDFIAENSGAAQKLAVLKDEIHSSGIPVMENYPCHWDGSKESLTDLDAFGQQVLEDLWTAISEEYPEDAPESDPLTIERQMHEAFAEERSHLHIGRIEEATLLTKHVKGTNRQPVVITGESGSGKSAFLATWYRGYAAKHPDDYVLAYFIGASPDSTDHMRLLRNMCKELKSDFDLEGDIPEDDTKLSEALMSLLLAVSKDRRIVILLDALDQLSVKEGAHGLGWLLDYLPANVHLVVSSLEGDSLEVLRRRGAKEIPLQQLTIDEQRQIVHAQLSEWGRKLDEQQISELLAHPGVENPLYLCVALEELRLFGSYEQLTGRIVALAPNVSSLFDQVLARLEEDHGREFVTEAFSLLGCSRYGLSENELLELLHREGEEQLPRALLVQLSRSAKAYLVQRGELVGFFHDQLRFAVYHRYLGMASPDAGSSEAYCKSHSQLADYFRGVVSDEGDPVVWRSDQPRGLRELPYHLVEAEREDELRGMLFDFGWLQAKLGGVDVNSLIVDYDYVPDDSDLCLVQGAIRLSAHVLARDRAQLAGQLLGRLQTFQESGIQSMLEQAREWEGGLWLCPLTASLTPPGGPLIRILGGHTYWVRAVAVTPDGTNVISGSADDTLKVWDIESGEELRTLTGHIGSVWAVAVTPDGKRVISGSSDKTLRVWDIESGEELRTLTGHTDLVWAVAVTPDGTNVISGSWDNTLKVWDIESGEELRTLTGHIGSVWAVAVTPDGKRVISGSSDKTLKVWDIERGEEIQTLTGHTDQVYVVAVTPDGKHVISGSYDNTIRMWDIESGEELRTLTGHIGSVWAVAVTPDGKRVISGSSDKTLKVWDIERGEEIQTLTGHTDQVYAVAVTPDGKHVISGSDDNTLKVWDIESREELLRLEGHTDSVNAVAVTPDGKHVISGSGDNILKVWDLESREELRTLTGHTNSVYAVAVTPDGKHVISGSGDNTLKVWDIKRGEELLTLTGHTNSVWAVAVTPDGKHVISGSGDNTLKVWDVESGEELRTLTGHIGWVEAVAVTPDGKNVISGSGDNTLRVWNSESGQIIASFIGNGSLLTCAVSLDGKTIVAGDASGRVHFLRLQGVE